MKEYICAETQVKNYAGATIGTTLWKGKELVRCKDCRHWNGEDRDCNIKVGHFTAPPDWFCADGEKRTD